MNIQELLLAARMLRPYYGKAIAALTAVEKPGIGTVAVDKWWRLYYDPEWLATLPERQQAGVIAAHEVEHLLRNHHARGDAALLHPSLMNIAGDLEINDDAEAGLLPDGTLHPSKFGFDEGLLMEEYARRLIDKAVTQAAGTCGGGSGAGEALPFELPASEAPGVTEDEADVIRGGVAADVKERQRSHGDVPANIVQWADAVIGKPKVDWRREVRTAAGRALRMAAGRDHYTFSRLHRRQRHDMPLRPATVKGIPRVGLVVDTSGSMGELGGQVLAEVNKLLSHAEVVGVACDAEAHHVGTVSRRTKWVGGGGTDLCKGIALLEREPKPLPLCIVITDGFTPWPARPPKFDLLAVVIGDAAVPEYARHVRVEVPA